MSPESRGGVVSPESGGGALRGVREPAQRRSLETLERLVSEAEALLVEGGPGAVTVQKVVSRADSSVGSFYARFDGREVLVRYLQDRFWQRATDRWDTYFEAERSRAGSALEFLAGFVRVLVRVLAAADGDRLTAFLSLALSDPELGLLDRTRQLDGHIVEEATELLLERLDDVDAHRRRVACREATRCILAAARDAVLFRDPTPREQRDLILSLVRMAAGGIGLDGAPDSYGDLLRLCRSSVSGTPT